MAKLGSLRAGSRHLVPHLDDIRSARRAWRIFLIECEEAAVRLTDGSHALG